MKLQVRCTSTSNSVSPLSSFDAGCVPVRKGGRLVWVSLERPGGSSSLLWSGTVRWRAADLWRDHRNKQDMSVFVQADSRATQMIKRQQCLFNNVYKSVSNVNIWIYI